MKSIKQFGFTGLSVLGIVVLYYLLAFIVNEVFGPQSTWFREESSYTEGVRHIGHLQSIFTNHPYVAVNADDLREKLDAISKEDPDFHNHIIDILHPSRGKYILDLTDFIPSEKATILSKKKIRVSGCEKEKILYLNYPQENTGYFFLCKKNTLNMARYWRCCP